MNTTYEVGQVERVLPLIGGCFGIVVVLTIVAFIVVVHCKIFAKAGFHWAMGLLMFIPVANFIALLILAFCEWPIQRELRALRQAPQAAPPQSLRGL